jgi:ribosomal protein S18 acetylase RimI-like enzyme
MSLKKHEKLDVANIKLRKANLSDLQSIKTLMESVFGPYGRIEEMFTKWITNDQYSVRLALVDEIVVGVCSWSIKLDEEFSKYESFGPKAIDFIVGKKSAWVVNLAVAPDFRKQGLGKKLASAHLDWLKSSCCDVVVGSSWVNGSLDNSQHLYLKSGFQKLGESREFLREQLQGNGAICAVCNTSDCSCNSIFFGIEVRKLIQHLDRL